MRPSKAALSAMLALAECDHLAMTGMTPSQEYEGLDVKKKLETNKKRSSRVGTNDPRRCLAKCFEFCNDRLHNSSKYSRQPIWKSLHTMRNPSRMTWKRIYTTKDMSTCLSISLRGPRSQLKNVVQIVR